MPRSQLAVLALTALLLLVSLVGAPYPQQTYLQHVPTLIGLVAWPFLARRWPLTNAAFLCLVAFAWLHILGARYIYSCVPYDEWSLRMFGVSVTDAFAFRRNHFDRVVHFCFGLLFVRPMWEICVRYLDIPRRIAYYAAFEFVLAFSMLYELFEWGLTLVLAGPDADAYNGQQGDAWDAQKDMALALVGALVALAVMFVTCRRRMDVRAIASPTPKSR